MSNGPSTVLPVPPALPRRSPTQGTVRRDQLLGTVVGVVLLALAMLMQPLLTQRRESIVYENKTSLDSFLISFPRLTLGGFRGLVAAFLWIQAEDDKNDRKWEQLETKYDIIGALEPYFVSVYIYHAWNQAYNLSAQWYDPDAKYKWVIDGLTYLYKGETFNPQAADLVLEEGQMYFLKLGGAFERLYYRAHWRSDISRFYTLDETNLKNKPDVTDALKQVHAIVVEQPDNHFHVTELKNPNSSSASDTRRGWGISITDADLFQHRNDGKAVGDPVEFRYGVSPFYFAYIEYLRCQPVGRPTTIGMNVINGDPAMSLRMWCRDDLYYSAGVMQTLFGPSNQAAAIDEEEYRNDLNEIRDCYRNVDMIAPRAVEIFQKNIADYPSNENVHRNHILESQYYGATGKAQAALFEALILWQKNNRQMTPEVKSKFLAALPVFDQAIAATLRWVDKMYPVVVGQPINSDRGDFEKYANALKAQQAGIQNMLTTPENQEPNMSFLFEEVVEK